MINTNLRQAYKHLTYIVLKDHDLRHEHLTQCQKEAELAENKIHTQFINPLLIIKKKREIHRFIRLFSKPTDKLGIKHIVILKDYSID